MEATYQPKNNRGLMKIMIPYYKKNRAVFFIDLFFAGLTTLCDLVLPMLLSSVTDTAANAPAFLTLGFIAKISSIYIVLRIIEIYARYYMQGTGHVMGARIEKDMRADVYHHLQTLPHAFYSQQKAGQILANMTTDLFDITEFSHHCPEEYFIGAIKLVVMFIILIQVDWLLTLILFSVIPFLFYFSGLYRRRMRSTQMAQRQQIGHINSNIEETILGIQVVKSFANERVEEQKFEKDNQSFLHIKEKFYFALAGFQSVSRIFDGIMVSIVLIGGGLSLLHHRITPGQFVAFILYVQTLLTTVSRIVEFTEQFQRGMTGLERFDAVMQTKSDIVEKDDAINLDHLEGRIVFDDVSFRYAEHEDLVLDHLSLMIEPGMQVAIVGPSGSGKTTLTNLIPRFYDVTGGRICVDGHDVRDVTLESLRSHIGMVQQDVYLFSGTIRENIRYGKPEASDEEIHEAARLAGALEFIEALPDGMDTYVGERGLRLSGGQKQRISIARVFLKNPPVLILDEATSALDNKSEKWIQKSLEQLAKGRTTITIAHRLSTIRNADQILVLTERGVEEQGNHETLMAKRGLYYDLYQVIENQQVLEKGSKASDE